MPRLKGKVAVITGGSSGQGLATAKRFVEEGAVVYTLDKAASPIGRSVAAVQGDVSNLADLDRLYAKIASEKGRIDVIFALPTSTGSTPRLPVRRAGSMSSSPRRASSNLSRSPR